MSYELYKTKIHSLDPVAVRLGQTEIHAPEHDTWGVVTCDSCGAEFAVGPNRIYASRNRELDCVKRLEAILAENHKKQQPHLNSYELGG